MPPQMRMGHERCLDIVGFEWNDMLNVNMRLQIIDIYISLRAFDCLYTGLSGLSFSQVSDE